MLQVKNSVIGITDKDTSSTSADPVGRYCGDSARDSCSTSYIAREEVLKYYYQVAEGPPKLTGPPRNRRHYSTFVKTPRTCGSLRSFWHDTVVYAHVGSVPLILNNDMCPFNRVTSCPLKFSYICTHQRLILLIFLTKPRTCHATR